MGKKISIGATIVVTLLACLVTFEATYLVLLNRFEAKYVQDIPASDETTGETESAETEESLAVSSEVMYKLVSKLEEVDYLYRNYYIGEMDDDTLIDMTVAGYVAGTGDDYAAYYDPEDF